MESTVVDQPRQRPLRMEALSTGKRQVFFYKKERCYHVFLA
jgi:hypothetical protein